MRGLSVWVEVEGLRRDRSDLAAAVTAGDQDWMKWLLVKSGGNGGWIFSFEKKSTK